MKILIILAITCSILLPTALADSNITINTNADSYEHGEVVKITGETPTDVITIQIKDPSGKTILIRNITANDTFSLNFNLPDHLAFGVYDIIASVTVGGIPEIVSTSITLTEDKETPPTSVIQDIPDVEEKDGITDSEGGGCLIATAAFGSEMAPQVQFLREIRDNTVMNTQSGTAFMTGFNQVYYSFSPAVADLERENPVFKEAVKVTLTPMLTSLTLLNYVEVDTEEEMLGYGISLILLNIGMYFVAPAAAIVAIKKRFF